LDRTFAEIAQDAPGFAGIYYEDESPGPNNQGRVVLLLRNPSTERSQALDALEGYRGGHYLSQAVAGNGGVRVQEVPFTFMQLAAWRKMAVQAVSDLGIVSVDIDERANQVALGFASSTTEEAALNALHNLSVPEGAIRTSVQEPVELLSQTLDDSVRPATGGLAIDQPGAGSSYDTYGCSMGLIATLSDGTDGMLTASHCTSQTFSYDGGSHYQDNSSSSTYLVGDEYADAATYSCSQNTNGCADSDVAFIDFSNLGTTQYGFTVARLDGSGGVTINSSNPTWPVVDDAVGSPPVGGQVIDKTGQNSGRTWGTVGQTCSDQLANDGYTRVCEYQVTASSVIGSPSPMAVGGDSGSPVYSFIMNQDGTGTGTIRAQGILWGHSSGSTGDFWFSEIDGVVNEFGSMTLY